MLSFCSFVGFSQNTKKTKTNTYVELDVQFYRPKAALDSSVISCGFTPFIKITNTDHKFVSANIYFAGNGFPNTISGILTGSSLSPFSNLLSKCVNGSIIVFDQIKVSDKMGSIRYIENCTYTLADSVIIRKPTLYNN
jgi:hypothetical protein